MAKLYPPQIEGTLPAFTDLAQVEIPFIMNQAVGWEEVTGFSLIVKDIVSNTQICTVPTDSFDKIYPKARFDLSGKQLSLRNYYKVQLAYINTNNEIGYYSTIGVIKYTSKPTLEIDQLSSRKNVSNINRFNYIGKYSNDDTTEKVYQYRFVLFDENIDAIHTSGWLLHTSEKDAYELKYNLQENKPYYLGYYVKTINGLEARSGLYKIIETKTVDPYFLANFETNYNRENAYIDVWLKGRLAASGEEGTVAGTYQILRASSEDDFATWQTIAKVKYYNEQPSKYVYRDYALAHGETYRYAIQQYNEHGIYSNKIYSEDIEVFFEYAYLYDGERQLKVKYNPKISSLKQNVLEQKTNTIGAKYPYIFRNGDVSYKEFPISGLVSYLSDEEELFMTSAELGLEIFEPARQKTSADASWKAQFNIESTDSEGHAFKPYAVSEKDSEHYKISNSCQKTTNLTDYNVAAEQRFKLKVLDFLNNGKPKLFRSPEEGNYIVYLMNSSLAPNDTLGRMIHTFSTTATEIADYNYDELISQGLVSIKEDGSGSKLQKKVYNLSNYVFINSDIALPLDNTLGPVFRLEVSGIKSNSLTIKYNKQRFNSDTEKEEAIAEIMQKTAAALQEIEDKRVAGLYATEEEYQQAKLDCQAHYMGEYKAIVGDELILGTEFYKNDDFYNIKLQSTETSQTGKITIYYEDQGINDFNKIKSISYEDVVIEQFHWDFSSQYNKDILSETGKIAQGYSLTFEKKLDGTDFKIQLNDQILTPINNITTIENVGEIYKLIIPKDIRLEMSYQKMEITEEGSTNE